MFSLKVYSLLLEVNIGEWSKWRPVLLHSARVAVFLAGGGTARQAKKWQICSNHCLLFSHPSCITGPVRYLSVAHGLLNQNLSQGQTSHTTRAHTVVKIRDLNSHVFKRFAFREPQREKVATILLPL